MAQKSQEIPANSNSPEKEIRTARIKVLEEAKEARDHLSFEIDITNSRKFRSYDAKFIEELEKGDLTNADLIKELEKPGLLTVSKVLALQILLSQLTYNDPENIDGILQSQKQKRSGALSKTEEALSQFREANGLRKNSSFGKRDIQKLKEIFAVLPSSAAPEVVRRAVVEVGANPIDPEMQKFFGTLNQNQSKLSKEPPLMEELSKFDARTTKAAPPVHSRWPILEELPVDKYKGIDPIPEIVQKRSPEVRNEQIGKEDFIGDTISEVSYFETGSQRFVLITFNKAAEINGKKATVPVQRMFEWKEEGGEEVLQLSDTTDEAERGVVWMRNKGGQFDFRKENPMFWEPTRIIKE